MGLETDHELFKVHRVKYDIVSFFEQAISPYIKPDNLRLGPAVTEISSKCRLASDQEAARKRLLVGKIMSASGARRTTKRLQCERRGALNNFERCRL